MEQIRQSLGCPGDHRGIETEKQAAQRRHDGAAHQMQGQLHVSSCRQGADS
jgi:hypothetical protein